VTSAQILFAYAADLAFADPPWLPHPVRVIGFLASWSENLCRKVGNSPRVLLTLGLLTSVLIPWAAAAATWLVIKEITKLSPLAGSAATVSLAYTTLSVRSLDVAAQVVINHLKHARISDARAALAMIVGRDTQTLDVSEIMRATIETVAENTSDGIVAPLFYLAVGGVPAAIAYKAINTLDSMFGYKNERYFYFGRASARLDDVANYLPARITAALVVVSALLLGLSWKKAIKIVRRDARSQPSPNSGFPEAAYAGALGIRLGGTNVYGGRLSHKAYLGDAEQALTIAVQTKVRRLLYATSTLAVAIAIVGIFVFRWIPCP
jgi:adenosylcobinamide-phosphate synthase